MDSNQQDIDALDALCQRLGGFDERISLEWLDGVMATLLAGPRVPSFEEWTQAVLGDAWTRAIADPQDQAQARATIQRRWKVLAAQLAPEDLQSLPNVLHLSPLMFTPDEAERDTLAKEMSAEELAELPALGEIWAHGVFDALDAFEEDWEAAPEDEGAAQVLEAGLELLALLLHPPGEGFDQAVKTFFDKPLSREEVVSEAAFALQDLRVLWSQHPPRTAPRAVPATPGRNDPCHCGSGRKFKKCHGA